MSNNYNNDSEEEKSFPGKGEGNSFIVPEGYFESLAARIMARIEMEGELDGLPELGRIPKKIVFEVPENYFNASENSLEYQWELSTLELLKGIKKPDTTKEQNEYFDGLDKKILQRIENTDEIKEFTLLSSIEKKNNFTVSPSYFENASGKVKESVSPVKVKEPGSGAVVRKLFSSKLAIAASIIIIIGCGITWYVHQQEVPVVSGDCKTLACLEKNELLNEKTISDFDEDNLYEMVDVDSLNKQLSDGKEVNAASGNKSDSVTGTSKK